MDLLKLSDWLQARQGEQVAMESTGEYWRPVFNILEVNFSVILGNASHVNQWELWVEEQVALKIVGLS